MTNREGHATTDNGGQIAAVRAGTGYVDLPASRAAGAAATRQALQEARLEQVDLAFCFHHGRHDADDVLAGVRSELGDDTPVLGGSAMGVFTNADLGYEGHQVGVAVLGGLAAPPVIVEASGLSTRSEAAVGRELGLTLRRGGDGAPVDGLLLYSSIRRGVADPDGLALNFATPLLASLVAESGPFRTLAGAGLIDSLQPSGSHVFTVDGADADAAAIVTLPQDLRMDAVVIHGCRPAGTYHTVTSTEGPVVLEIDGRPALDVIDELLGGDLPLTDYPFHVILGVNHGSPYGAFQEEKYQTRLCLAVDEGRRALVMFEPDLQPGARVQLMRVAPDFEYLEERVRTLLEQLRHRRAVLALYADCAGRCVMGSTMSDEEGHAVRAAVGNIPLLGFYTGVEIAPVAHAVRPLDWTGVLCVLSV